MQMPFYGPYIDQPASAGTVVNHKRNIIGTIFYCLPELLTATKTYELGRR